MEETVKKPKETAKDSKYYNELVTVKLFKDTSKYKDDVFAQINGENVLIKRGEPVKIKRKFATLLKQSSNQDYKTAKFMDEKENEFKAESKKFNV